MEGDRFCLDLLPRHTCSCPCLVSRVARRCVSVLCKVAISAAAEPGVWACSGTWLLSLQRVLGFRSKSKAMLIDAALHACAGASGGWIGEPSAATLELRRLIRPYLHDMTCEEAVAAMVLLQDYVSGVRGGQVCGEDDVAC